MQSQSEVEETFSLSIANNLQDAVNKVTAFLGLSACDKSSKVATDKNTHTLFLSVWNTKRSPRIDGLNRFPVQGVFVGGDEVLARLRFVFDKDITLNIVGLFA